MDEKIAIAEAILKGSLAPEEETLAETLIAKHGLGVFDAWLAARARNHAQEKIYQQLGVSEATIEQFNGRH